MRADIPSIRKWCAFGAEIGATHVLIVALDRELGATLEYPAFVMPSQSARQVADFLWINLQSTRVVECYNLSMDIEDQLRHAKAWNL